MTDDSAVLVVDDEHEVADSYAEALSGEYSVTVAYSGTEALEAFNPDVGVVLLDRRMPELTGDEVLDELKQRDADCRIVMVTAVEPTLDIVEMEFDEYLVKPVTTEQLRDVVARMLARRELETQVQEIFDLASKLATLESKLSLEQLDSSDEYAALRSEFERLRQDVELPDSTDDPYFDATVEKVRALLDERR